MFGLWLALTAAVMITSHISVARGVLAKRGAA
jgi:hypothetical protein